MKDDLTKVVFILDMSGSMQSFKEVTIKGYNDFLEKQSEVKGKANISTVLFNNQIHFMHQDIDLEHITFLTEDLYKPQGSTALYDALGYSIDNVGSKLNETNIEDRPAKVIFVVMTDGHENASSKYSQRQIRSMITHQREVYNWDFIFLGANIDAKECATHIGIPSWMSRNFEHTNEGHELNYEQVGLVISKMRQMKKTTKEIFKSFE